MKLTWLGHSGFRMEVGDQILLIDPWLTGNPAFEGQDRAEAIRGATHVLVTHGHGDHTADALDISKETGAPIVCIFELAEYWNAQGVETKGFGKGGTLHLGDVAVTMVHAVHSSSLGDPSAPVYAGGEAGFMIAHGGRTVYVSGDTDVTADMGIMQALHAPQIGVLCVGGHFTMDQKRAAYAAETFFRFETIVPCHFGTFPVLAQDVSELKSLLPGTDIREPKVMEPMEL